MSISLRITKKPNFNKIERKVDRALDAGIDDFIKAGAEFMKNSVPVKSGKLRDSIKHNESEIWSTSKYYKYIDEGTKPHVIEGNPLVFTINGVQVFTTMVNHPGTEAHNITDSTNNYLESNVNIIARKIRKVL